MLLLLAASAALYQITAMDIADLLVRETRSDPIMAQHLSWAYAAYLQRLGLGLVAFDLVVSLAVLGLSWWLVGRILKPLEHSLERERRFVADAGHELRLPLTVIRTEAELALPHAGEGQAEAWHSVLEEADRLSHLVSQMLQLARAEARPQTASTAHDLASVARSVGQRLAPLAESRRQKLHLKLSGSGQVMAESGEALQTVVANLVDNALRAAPDGGNIWVELYSTVDGVRLVVADDGPGIPPEKWPVLFERFYRTDPARGRDDGSGAGLGLAIVRAEVEKQGGHVTVTSPAGGGARFVVSWPAPHGSASGADHRLQRGKAGNHGHAR